MNPAEIRILVAAIALAAAAAAGFAGGYKLNGWILGTAVADKETQRVAAVDQAKVLAGSVQACTAGVELTAKTSAGVLAEIRARLADLAKHGGETAASVASIEALVAGIEPVGASCDKAWDALEADHQKRLKEKAP